MVWNVQSAAAALVASVLIGGVPVSLRAQAPVLIPEGERVVPPAPPAMQDAPDGEPWLGVTVSKPSAALYAQVSQVPEGVGFLVDGIAPDGPAERAGLARYDFLWKLDDQLLVNESQFLTLLALQEVGRKVRLTYYRGGKNHEAEAILAARPAAEQGNTTADLAVLSPPGSNLPVRILNVAEKVAILKDEEGAVKIQKLGAGYEWILEDTDGNETSRGVIEGAAPEQIPPTVNEPLRSKLSALVRSFEAVEARERMPHVRPPRIRRVPVPDPAR